ncbi:MAG: CoA transferase subunit A [Anaerolineae bacterium]|nr:CoA transferase subunit A [Anaerolineae bacterium]
MGKGEITGVSMKSKLITMEEAASIVQSGNMLALGGMTLYRRPVGFARTLITRFQESASPADLTLMAFTAGYESDLLVGAGMVSHVRSCYFGLEIFGFAPMFTNRASQGLIEVIEETETSLSMGLRAQMASVGFMPGLGWLGTDLPRLRPDVRTVIDPYSGEEMMAFPAISPDVAVIHALTADQDGNALIGDNKGVDIELSLASKIVIITAEELVAELDKADIVAPCVDAVVYAPRGAAPTSCHPLYGLDASAILDYAENVSDQDSFDRYLYQAGIKSS